MKIKKVGFVRLLETFEEVAGLQIEEAYLSDQKVITGTVWQHGGGKPRMSWTMTGQSIYPGDPNLDMTNIKIYKESNENQKL